MRSYSFLFFIFSKHILFLNPLFFYIFFYLFWLFSILLWWFGTFTSVIKVRTLLAHYGVPELFCSVWTCSAIESKNLFFLSVIVIMTILMSLFCLKRLERVSLSLVVLPSCSYATCVVSFPFVGWFVCASLRCFHYSLICIFDLLCNVTSIIKYVFRVTKNYLL